MFPQTTLRELSGFKESEDMKLGEESSCEGTRDMNQSRAMRGVDQVKIHRHG